MTATVKSTITFPYKRSLGPVLGAFMTALTEERLIGIRDGDRVICPPLEWDPRTGAELGREFVDVGPAGSVDTWCWVEAPSEQHPLDHPFAFATIRLDGADTSLVHVVDAGTGTRCRSGCGWRRGGGRNARGTSPTSRRSSPASRPNGAEATQRPNR